MVILISINLSYAVWLMRKPIGITIKMNESDAARLAKSDDFMLPDYAVVIHPCDGITYFYPAFKVRRGTQAVGCVIVGFSAHFLLL